MNDYGCKAMVLDYGVDYRREMFDVLYEQSALTWEGLALEGESDAQEILDFLCGEGFLLDNLAPGLHMIFNRTTGADMNQYWHLTGSNAYPDDLTIVSVVNSMFDVPRMVPVQLRLGARWYDDIVDNNARREREKWA